MSGTFSDDYVRVCAGLAESCRPTDVDISLSRSKGTDVVLAEEVLDLRARVAELEAERADLDRILSRRDALLRGIADGLRGPAPDGLVWGDHADLPELAARMRAAGSRGEQ